MKSLIQYRFDNAGCLLGGKYKAPMVIIKKISQVWSPIIIGTEFDLFGASVRQTVFAVRIKIDLKT